MKWLTSIIALTVCACQASAQCGAISRRPFVRKNAVVVQEVAAVIATPIAIAVPVVTVVAAYGAAYVPPQLSNAAYGSQAIYGSQQSQQSHAQTACEQNVAALLARIEALERGGTMTQPSVPTIAPPAPVPQPLPSAPPAVGPPVPTAPGIKPILNVPSLFNRSCIQCHASTSAGGPKGKLVLDSGKPLACEQRLEILRRINLLPTDKDSMPPQKAGHTPVTDAEAAELMEWATKK